MAIIQGPPGTGKTRLALTVILALILSSNKNLILASAPKNSSVADLVHGLRRRISTAQGHFPKKHIEKCYILHMRSASAELEIFRLLGPRVNIKNKFPKINPAWNSTQLLEEHRKFMQSPPDDVKFKPLHDRNNRDPTCSAAYMIFFISGLIPNHLFNIQTRKDSNSSGTCIGTISRNMIQKTKSSPQMRLLNSSETTMHCSIWQCRVFQSWLVPQLASHLPSFSMWSEPK